MARLPQTGSDAGTWGDILNEFLLQTHQPDGQIKDNVITAAQITDGTITAASLDPAVQGQIAAAAPAADPVFTGTVTVPTPVNPTDAATKAYVDSNVPASTQTALDLKLDKAGGTVTGQMLLTATTGNSLVVDTSTLTVDATNHRVGIGTASPAAALQVIGRTRLYGGPEVLPSDLVEITANNESVSDHTTGLRATTDFNPSAAGLSLRALSGSVSDNVASTQAIGLMRGMDFAASHNGSGTIGELTGLLTYTTARNVGNVTNLYGAYLRQGTLTGASGTVNTLYGARIENLKQAGTINNAYGLYIDNVNQGSTLNYAIYSGGGQSYFAGNLGVKNLSPAVPLDVTGEARVSTAGTNATSVVTVGGTQTLTNKTLTSPALSTPTGIIKADVGLGNVDNTSDATKNSATATLTNKRITSRIGTVASSATPTPDASANDQYNITALAVNATVGAPTGTPTDGQRLTIRILDNGTSKTLAWDAIYRSMGDLLPTKTVASKQMYCDFQYNSADSKWDMTKLGTQDSSGVDVQTFFTNGTWTKPVGVTTVKALVISGGGGGGSGRRGAAGTVRCGGGGGAGGVVAEMQFTATSLAETAAIQVGTGGLGGAGITADDTNGTTPNGASTETISRFGFYLGVIGPYTASYGSGNGGTATSGAGGVIAPGGTIVGQPGAAASTTGGVGGGSGIVSVTPIGGGAGGGITSANVANNGGTGGRPYCYGQLLTAGGVVDGALPAAAATTTTAVPSFGSSGGGGAASITQAAQAGADGGSYGGGGGGGGASLNGYTSGKGGNGAPGLVVVTSW